MDSIIPNRDNTLEETMLSLGSGGTGSVMESPLNPDTAIKQIPTRIYVSATMDSFPVSVRYKGNNRLDIGGFPLEADGIPLEATLSTEDLFGLRACLTEWEALRRLYGHPNIVQAKDFRFLNLKGELTSELVMENINGQNLRRRLEAGCMAPEDIGNIIAGLADALAYSAKLGITNADLKPNNVMIREGVEGKGSPVLIDYGIAVIDEAKLGKGLPFGYDRLAADFDLARGGSVFGTLYYFSPEQAKGYQITPASDVFNLGLIMYECMAGKRAFKEGVNNALLEVANFYDAARRDRFVNDVRERGFTSENLLGALSRALDPVYQMRCSAKELGEQAQVLAGHGNTTYELSSGIDDDKLPTLRINEDRSLITTLPAPESIPPLF